MAIKVFYSWQSDVRPNRNFIRSALDGAVGEINKQFAVDEAQREIVVDQDTQGLPGSPGIADAILQKIRASDIFVADLTFIDSGSGERRLPNPNVMLEYGYALHTLGDAKIIGIFNEAHGSPEQLPFDLGHRRWPIRFNLDSDQQNRAAEKQALTRALKAAIDSIVSQFQEQGLSVTPFPASAAGDGIGRLRSDSDFLCVASDYSDATIKLAPGPYVFLRLMPTQALPELGEVEAYRIAQRNLRPMTGHERS